MAARRLTTGPREQQQEDLAMEKKTYQEPAAERRNDRPTCGMPSLRMSVTARRPARTHEKQNMADRTAARDPPAPAASANNPTKRGNAISRRMNRKRKGPTHRNVQPAAPLQPPHQDPHHEATGHSPRRAGGRDLREMERRISDEDRPTHRPKKDQMTPRRATSWTRRNPTGPVTCEQSEQLTRYTKRKNAKRQRRVLTSSRTEA